MQVVSWLEITTGDDKKGLKHRALGRIIVRISKARAPIKSDRALAGLLGCHSKEKHIQHENPPHLTCLLVKRTLRDESLMNPQLLQSAMEGESHGVHVCKSLVVCPCMCVCVCV